MFKFNRWIYGDFRPLMDAPDDGGGGGNDPAPSFEDLLKDPNYRAELDKHVTKALETAKVKWNEEKEKELKTAKDEAERLAKMNAEERAKLEQEKREAALTERERKVAISELQYTARDELKKRNLPEDLFLVLNYESAETCKASMDAVEKSFQSSVEKAVNDKLRGTPPGAGGSADSVADAKLRAAFGLNTKKEE